jgi:hypothetical protein
VWKLKIVGRTTTTRGGTTSPLNNNSKAVRWTFPAADCSDTVCSGTITSSSDKSFAFSWDGHRLDVIHPDTVATDPKVACVDTTTGAVQPIAQSAARRTYHYHFAPFVGSQTQMVSKDVVRTSYEFFGDCQPGPTDTVKDVYDWILTPSAAQSS